MFINKKLLSESISKDTKTSFKTDDIKVVVYQDLLWGNFTECKVHTEKGSYSCLFKDGVKTSEFALLPKTQETK